jgi:hypothetical protein
MTNGYIQMDVLGRRRGLKFGMLATQRIMLEAQKLNTTLGTEVDVALIPVIVYWGLFNNCYVKREDPDFTFEEVCDWVDDNISNPGLFTDIIKCFYSSRIVKADIPGSDENEKKSSTSRRKRDGKTSARR